MNLERRSGAAVVQDQIDVLVYLCIASAGSVRPRNNQFRKGDHGFVLMIVEQQRLPCTLRRAVVLSRMVSRMIRLLR